MGHPGDAAAAFGATPVEPGHLGVQAGLVDEDQLLAVPTWLGASPQDPGRLDIRLFLLGGVRRFFIAQAQPVQLAPKRSNSDLDAQLFPAALLEFSQGQISLLGDPRPQDRLMRSQTGATIAANLLRPAMAGECGTVLEPAPEHWPLSAQACLFWKIDNTSGTSSQRLTR